MSALTQNKRIHFIGIGGSGMNGIAEVLIRQGYQVSGSDLNRNAAVERLEALGATVYLGHAAHHVENVDAVVISTAVSIDNEELLAAKKRHLPVLRRAEMLSQLMNMKTGIAVAGTHGKTTTTSLVASVLAEAGLDPTYVIGGLLKSSATNAYLGESEYFVAEADESDASFLYLHPQIAIVTNIDADHMATYDYDFERLQQTFIDFLHQLPFAGFAVLCIDDPVVRNIAPKIARPMLTYGFSSEADFRITNFVQQGAQSTFEVLHQDHPPLTVRLNLPGKHYALNATAAIALAKNLNIPDQPIVAALAKFEGVGRRFQMFGELDIKKGQVLFIDDYGHHPREILATLSAVRAAWPERRIVLAYQPHRYSRTKELFTEFVEVLASLPDVLLLMNVYSAGEQPIADADSQALYAAIKKRGTNDIFLVGDVENLPSRLREVLMHGDVLLTQGAGSIGTMAAQLAKQNDLGEGRDEKN